MWLTLPVVSSWSQLSCELRSFHGGKRREGRKFFPKDFRRMNGIYQFFKELARVLRINRAKWSNPQEKLTNICKNYFHGVPLPKDYISFLGVCFCLILFNRIFKWFFLINRPPKVVESNLFFRCFSCWDHWWKMDNDQSLKSSFIHWRRRRDCGEKGQGELIRNWMIQISGEILVFIFGGDIRWQ